jgi:hypothetical protein
VQPAARSNGVMQQASLPACIISNCLYVLEQGIACRPKWKHAVKSVVYASRSIGYARIFLMKLIFVQEHKLHLYVMCGACSMQHLQQEALVSCSEQHYQHA